MTIEIEPKNPEAGILGKPNRFWNALLLETPASKIAGCSYTDRGTIKYEHDGYVGAWFSEQDAHNMHSLLSEFVQTQDYKQHPYFGQRQNQMESMLGFLPLCGGFRVHF